VACACAKYGVLLLAAAISRGVTRAVVCGVRDTPERSGVASRAVSARGVDARVSCAGAANYVPTLLLLMKLV
jgi:hypothetical protein